MENSEHYNFCRAADNCLGLVKRLHENVVYEGGRIRCFTEDERNNLMGLIDLYNRALGWDK